MKQSPEEATIAEERLLPGQAPVLAPGHNFRSRSRTRSLRSCLRRPVTLGWAIGLLIAFADLTCSVWR
jgi:hypothetical protein